ncbi:MAG: SUMF1/EgtB/PvdO family nonheme iron enzyme [Saprospiraceae bacterium]|nr:SUMF1/EgtB/PvdO family nonheme iron enzyme [Saprospiraceae bacterium]
MITAQELDRLQARLRQMLPDLGISSVLNELKQILPEQTIKFTSVFQLETRLNSINKDRIRGILTQEDLDVAYNKISSDLFELIDGLSIDDFDIHTAQSSVADKEGSILYRIPKKMEVEEEYRCIVRLAFDMDTVVKNIELTPDTVVKDVRVSEVMEVELIDPGATPRFAIRKLNSVEQFLEKHEFTEWVFFVQPLMTGEYPLVLKVAVKELINDKERIREIVLEETVLVVAEPAPDDDKQTFLNAGYSISCGNARGSGAPESVPPAASKPKAGLLLLIGLIVGTGMLATGIYLGWFSGLLPQTDQTEDDRRFWEKMYQTHTRSSFESYLLAYPGGLFKDEARRKIDSLIRIEKQHIEPVVEPLPDVQIPEPEPDQKPTSSATPKPKPKPKPKLTPIPNQTPAPSKPTEAPAQKPSDTKPVEKPEPPVEQPKRNRKSGFEMVRVAGGKYTSKVEACTGNTLEIKDFRLGKYEITQGDWKEIMGTRPAYHSNCDECPVEKVSWDDIQRFIKIASQKHKKKYRLPYEIEWEYAARGGQSSRGMKYAGGNDPNQVAWFNIIQEKTREVGTKRPNELGIFDLSGNVWEWCEGPYPAYLPCKPVENEKKALRGGSWADGRSDVTITARRREKPKYADRRSGFRLLEE